MPLQTLLDYSTGIEAGYVTTKQDSRGINTGFESAQFSYTWWYCKCRLNGLLQNYNKETFIVVCWTHIVVCWIIVRVPLLISTCCLFLIKWFHWCQYFCSYYTPQWSYNHITICILMFSYWITTLYRHSFCLCHHLVFKCVLLSSFILA